jgi:hypothetical protein
MDQTDAVAELLENANVRAALRRPPRDVYYRPMVCKQSWAWLTELAKRARYIAPGADRAKGVTRYIIDSLNHPQQEWLDSRPAYLRATDVRLATPEYENATPIWIEVDHCDGGRKQRTIPKQGFPIDVVVNVATELKLNSSPYRLTPSCLEGPNVTLGAFLEIWGQGHLTAAHIPTTPPGHYYRKRQKDFSW